MAEEEGAAKAAALDRAINDSLARRRRNSTLRGLSLSPPGAIDFSSNDFLSLSRSPLLRRRYAREWEEHSHLPLGSGGSRLLDGNSTYAASLEGRIATFHNAPFALLANSGFDANVAIFSTLPRLGDVVLYDSLIHASVHDGMRASRLPASRRHAFEHNSLASFRTTLTTALATVPDLLDGHASLFIALEAVYSMDGDLAPLSSILSTVDALVPSHARQNVHVVLDEAHSTGILGPGGRGLACGLGVEDRVSVRLHTFGKSLSANGAAILCSENVKEYLLNYARPLIYTTFLSFPSLALVAAAYSLLEDGSTAELLRAVRRNMMTFHEGLVTLQADLTRRYGPRTVVVGGEVIRVTSDRPESPIFSVRTRDPRGLAAWCQRVGFVVRPIVPPTVPEGSERVRVCLHSGNTIEEINGLLESIKKWCEMTLNPRQNAPEADLGDVTDIRAKL